jgi:hypothetical protein
MRCRSNPNQIVRLKRSQQIPTRQSTRAPLDLQSRLAETGDSSIVDIFE